jgi:hypothetical protein
VRGDRAHRLTTGSRYYQSNGVLIMDSKAISDLVLVDRGGRRFLNT